jgi:hypothetical protein
LEFLGEPVAPRRTFQGIGYPCWVGEAMTPVMPDEFITLVGRAVPRRTALIMRRVYELGRTPTDILAWPMRRRPRHAGGLAHATTDSRPSEVGRGLVVPRGARLVEGQFGLDAINILLADQRRARRDQHP